MKTRIRFLCLLLAAACLFALVSCTKQDPDIPDGFFLAENEGGDFLFYYPQTWVLDRNDAGMVSAYVSEMDFSSVSVTAFTASNEYATLADYAQNHFYKMFEDNFSGLTYETNEDGTPVITALTVDGCDAVSVLYSASFSGEAYRFRSCMVSFNGYIYTITYTAKSALFDSHSAEVDQIISYFRFK